jgi:glycosidase
MLALSSLLIAAPDEQIGVILQPTGLLKAVSSDSDLVPVEFEFKFLKFGTDSGVGINGTFNNWGDVYPMHLTVPLDGWTRTMNLAPGSYVYKFVTYIDTVGQAGVTGWYTDPLNPVYKGPFRDSFIDVADPMIYYPSPMPESEVTDSKPLISFKIAHSLRRTLDRDACELIIDGIPVSGAGRYYNSATHRLAYTPKEALFKGAHTVTLRIRTTDGATAEYSTAFTTLSGIGDTPLTLTFDGRNPHLVLNEIPAEATLEWMDLPLSHPLADPDGDGYFTREIRMKLNDPHYYRIVVDKQIYLEFDPGNPLLNEEYRSVVVNHFEPKGHFHFLSPRPDTLLSDQLQTLTIRAAAVPGDSGFALAIGSLAVAMDGAAVAWQLDSAKNPVEIEITAPVTPGRHYVHITADDESGEAFIPGYLAFGVYGAESGVHVVDAERDDTGPGSYAYPAGVTQGCADIRSAHVAVSAGLDSLLFDVEMRTVADETRLGFLLYNRLGTSLTAAPEELDLLIPAWQGNGLYATLAAPGTTFFRPERDNRLYRDAVTPAVDLALNGSAKEEGWLRFGVAIADLEKLLGSFNQEWHVTLYSFLLNGSGSFELDAATGGVAGTDEPDLYDVAFCSNDQVQADLLANYIYSYKLGGPRTAAIGTDLRGSWPLQPAALHPQLGQGARLTLHSNGGEIFRHELQLAGDVTDPAVAQVILQVNGAALAAAVQNGRFEADITLLQGVNEVFATATGTGGQVLRSPAIRFTCRADTLPQVHIATRVTDQLVTLDGSGTTDPLGRVLSYAWSADPRNPQAVNWSGGDAAAVSFTAPGAAGEYYFTLTVTPAGGVSAWRRTVMLVDNGQARVPDLDTWHPAWVDSAVAYEIYTRTFNRSGRFANITSKLAELRDLGVTVLYLRPIHPSTAVHGYWITDYYGINPDYGTAADFDNLVKSAHKLGLRVVLDYVVNHTVDMHPYMQDALAWENDSPFHDFYRWNPDGSFHYYYTWVNLPSINFESKATRQYLIDMACWWVQRFNIDGFRCDVAHRIEKDRPSGPLFWQEWRAALKALKPDLWLLAEADADDAAYYDKKFDSAYDYRWVNAVFNLNSSLATADQLHEVVQYYLTQDFPAYAQPKRSLEDFDNARYLAHATVEQVKLAAALQLTSPGVPMLYAGQEVGELTDRGLIRWNDPNQLKKYYRTLIQLRRKNPALSTGGYTAVQTDQPLVYAFMRADSFLVIANFAGRETTATLSVPAALLPADTLRVFYLNDQLIKLNLPVTAAALRAYSLWLPAQSVRILKIGAVATGVERGEEEPAEFGLQPNFPNPFNPVTEIRFTIGGSAAVAAELQVFNVLGQRVRLLLQENKNPGRYRVVWDGRDDRGRALGAGVYFYTLTAGSFTRSRKMLLLK